jgi:hypothetical protein
MHGPLNFKFLLSANSYVGLTAVVFYLVNITGCLVLK